MLNSLLESISGISLPSHLYWIQQLISLVFAFVIVVYIFKVLFFWKNR
jgi:hypothetical protein